jgi:hypothetical protein
MKIHEELVKIEREQLEIQRGHLEIKKAEFLKKQQKHRVYTSVAWGLHSQPLNKSS